jgi:hypothetical protein
MKVPHFKKRLLIVLILYHVCSCHHTVIVCTVKECGTPSTIFKIYIIIIWRYSTVYSTVHSELLLLFYVIIFDIYDIYTVYCVFVVQYPPPFFFNINDLHSTAGSPLVRHHTYYSTHWKIVKTFCFFSNIDSSILASTKRRNPINNAICIARKSTY